MREKCTTQFTLVFFAVTSATDTFLLPLSCFYASVMLSINCSCLHRPVCVILDDEGGAILLEDLQVGNQFLLEVLLDSQQQQLDVHRFALINFEIACNVWEIELLIVASVIQPAAAASCKRGSLSSPTPPWRAGSGTWPGERMPPRPKIFKFKNISLREMVCLYLARSIFMSMSISWSLIFFCVSMMIRMSSKSAIWRSSLRSKSST